MKFVTREVNDRLWKMFPHFMKDWGSKFADYEGKQGIWYRRGNCRWCSDLWWDTLLRNIDEVSSA